jgi:hypothetical protein
MGLEMLLVHHQKEHRTKPGRYCGLLEVGAIYAIYAIRSATFDEAKSLQGDVFIDGLRCVPILCNRLLEQCSSHLSIISSAFTFVLP